MAVPKTYLTSTKNLSGILTTIQQAQAPKQFSVSFLQALGFKGNADRLIIGTLKSLGFLDASGTPAPRYFEYLDQTQGARVLASAIREAYSDLFELNVNAHKMTKDEVKNKLKTLTQGQFSDDVLSKMATTFVALAAEADFEAIEPAVPPTAQDPGITDGAPKASAHETPSPRTASNRSRLGGLVYNIQIQLPESRDPAVYDALFKSLRLHLLDD